MAIDGTYEVTTQTPMGPQKGKLVFKTEGDTLTGSSEGQGNVVAIQNGKVNGDQFEFMVEAKSPMGLLKITMSGKIEGDTLTGEAKTPFGPAKITGNRVV
jgi:hypothetical protein